jgi:hypothetical protein
MMQEPGGQIVQVGLAVTALPPSMTIKAGATARLMLMTTIRTSITGDSQWPASDALVYVEPSSLMAIWLFTDVVQHCIPMLVLLVLNPQRQ